MLPRHLAHHAATVYRRLADLLETGKCDPAPILVVVHDAPHVLADKRAREVVEAVARHGHQVGVSLELRGREPVASVFELGGSVVLVGAITLGRATYRCSRR